MVERRRYLRYSPGVSEDEEKDQLDNEHVAYIDLETEGPFHPKLVGFLVQKSHAGCCLVVPRENEASEALERDFECRIKAGPLHPLTAVVRWRRDLDEELLKAGFQFLE